MIFLIFEERIVPCRDDYIFEMLVRSLAMNTGIRTEVLLPLRSFMSSYLKGRSTTYRKRIIQACRQKLSNRIFYMRIPRAANGDVAILEDRDRANLVVFEILVLIHH